MRAVTQSPVSSIVREIWACTESTSSISDGGDTMQPTYIALAISRMTR